jgi:5-methylcytosine-specific restriction endonuclease McrA
MVGKKRRREYQTYLHSPRWIAKREQVFAVQGRCCRRCHSTVLLQIHHRTYERFGRERLTDLVPLCRRCHRLVHAYHNAHPNLSLARATSLVVGG